MVRRALCIFFLSILLGFLSSCVRREQVRERKTVELPALVFTARGGKVVDISQEDDEALFQKASRAYKEGKFRSAAENFEKIVRNFPNSELFQSALYNLGLSYEQLEDYPSAIRAYRKLLKLRDLDEEFRRDALFRLAYSLYRNGEFQASRELYFSLLNLKGLEPSDRLEIYSQLGVNHWNLKEYQKALYYFRKAAQVYLRSSREEDLEGNFFAAQAYFYIGLYYDRQFRERKFRSKVEEMREDLEFKARNILAAQSSYIRAIKVRNSVWTVRALYRIGAMYRQLYDDLMAAPTTGLKPDELPVYYKLLRQKIKVLLKKAMYAYERNLMIAAKLGLREHPVIKRTKRELEMLRQRIIQEFYSDNSDRDEKELEEK